jgi:uroporphyrin-III C-methyltransferase
VTVALVGAGPGDPGLITVRGLELLRRCDAVVYDRLVAPELVDETPADALRIPRDGLEQHEIDTLLVALGRQGLDVVRLKGGDPYVFGRGGEEALALAEAGIPFEVVPGISSIAAVPAAAGIPVTHRGVADRVTIATAHAADGSPPDYASLAVAGGTLVLFMGLGRLGELAAGLIGAGMAAATPAAVVARGTLPDQEVVTAPLEEIAETADGLPGPALVVIGEAVALAARLGLQRRRAGVEDAADAPYGLADPVLVLDEGETDEALATRAEARSR